MSSRRKKRARRVRGLRLNPKIKVRRIVRNQNARSSGIGIIVLHTTEGHPRPGVSDLEGLAAYFDRPDVEASSHVAVDDDGWSARMVADARKAWTVGNLNSMSLNIEIIGFAAWSRETWRRNFRTLREVARWIALWSRRHDIPIQRAQLTTSGRLLRKGVTTHDYCSSHGAGSDHWDPGPGFPVGFVMWLARGFKAAQILTRRKKEV